MGLTDALLGLMTAVAVPAVAGAVAIYGVTASGERTPVIVDDKWQLQ